jgi:hypothetical protein
MNTLTTFIANHAFKKIGHYHLSREGKVERSAEVMVSQRKPLVYAIFCGEQCRYIGKTIQGYGRPLNYHKNDVMTTVRNGIASALAENLSVDVYAKEENLTLEHEGLYLNAIEAVEQALISKYQPDWKNFSQAPVAPPISRAD